MKDLTAKDVNSLIRRYIKQTLDADEEKRLMDNEPFDPDFHADHEKVLRMSRQLLQRRLASNDRAFITETVDRLLETEDITLDKNSKVYWLLCREMFKAEDFILSTQEKRHQGDYDQDPTWMMESIANKGSEASDDTPIRTLSEIQEIFFEEGEAEKRWRDEKTKREVRASQQVLIDYFGNVPVNSLDRKAMGQFRRDLWKLPPNMNKSKAYRDLTIHEILALDPPPEKTIKELTVDKYLRRANALFETARINGEIIQNPMEGMIIKKKKKASERREIWSKEELKRIFGAPGYTENKFSRSYMFWTPLLALFTGARQEEICNLRLTDFEEYEGIWCLNILADDGKKLKNLQSRRLIPLHPFLIKLGIIRRCELMKELGYDRFMPDLKPSGGKYGPYVSKWFNERFKTSLGFPTGAGKDFHSFRHTFGTNMGHNDVNDHHLSALMGHAESGITFNFYVKRGTPPKLHQSLVEHLDYGIDLDHLKGSRWITDTYK